MAKKEVKVESLSVKPTIAIEVLSADLSCQNAALALSDELASCFSNDYEIVDRVKTPLGIVRIRLSSKSPYGTKTIVHSNREEGLHKSNDIAQKVKKFLRVDDFGVSIEDELVEQIETICSVELRCNPDKIDLKSIASVVRAAYDE